MEQIITAGAAASADPSLAHGKSAASWPSIIAGAFVLSGARSRFPYAGAQRVDFSGRCNLFAGRDRLAFSFRTARSADDQRAIR